MATVNPSHLLISRNSPRSPAHPQLVPTFSSRHTLPASFFSDDHVGGGPSDASARTRHHRQVPAVVASGDGDEEDEEVEIHAHFGPGAALTGTVKVVVGHTEFWCHKEILWFASPFFQGLLQGSWAETHAVPSTVVDADVDVNPVDLQREASLSTDTDQPGLASVPERNSADELDVQQDEDAESRKTSVYLDAADETPNVADILRELREIPDPIPQSISSLTATLGSSAPGANTLANSALPPEQRPLPTVPSYPSSPRRRGSSSRSRRQSAIRHSFSSLRPCRVGQPGVAAGAEAVVELHETSAAAFQDFLFWAYPGMECKVSWTNVEDLLALASKLLAPPLQSMCEHFLVSHASGKPVVALRLAEIYNNAELFREASRFVLDQPNWDPNEMMDLSSDTRLRLALRWFLERLLKLSSIDVRKEYTCRSDCPDPAKCQAQLDEKWRQAITNVSRYGPPQPSVAFRCLRQLETFVTNPSLVMPHPLCQTAAKSWVMTQAVFDRMFQPKILSHPLNPGTEKYWLCIALN